MTKVEEIISAVGEHWIPEIYSEQIRPLRTRSLELPIPQKENAPEIIETLLGIELKVGKRRIACPDAATARYLQVFARIGAKRIAVPYDITAIPALADVLEDSWAVFDRAIRTASKGMTPQQTGRLRSAAIRLMRDEIDKAGAGELMPLFNRSTRQRD